MSKKNSSVGNVFYTVSLGCPKNLVDTEYLAGHLLTAGYSLSFDPEAADLYLINTCAFLPSAREEAFGAIRDGLRWKKRRAGRRLIVAGCLTERDTQKKYRTEYPGVDLWLGVDDIPHVAELVGGAVVEEPSAPERKHPTYLCSDEEPRLQLTMSHMAYLKIADGCDNCCAYCAIPAIRGRLRSRPVESVLAEARDLVTNNKVRELVLIAQDVTCYGKDRGDGTTLCGLLKALEEMEGDFKIRLLYTHPAHYTDELIDFLAASKRVLPYLDIPLQHISDRLLLAMNRHVDRKGIEDLLQKLRSKIPMLTLRTTFITGLPGESAEEFEQLCEFVKAQKFERCGVFSFSAEEGTRAAGMADQVPGPEALRRAKKLMRLQEKIMVEQQSKYLGKTIGVVVDDAGESGGCAIARGAMDAPEIDNVVLLRRYRGISSGDVVQVKITGLNGADLVGERSAQ
ncbi:MAG: 30S ribosomal protein S12 methylthiotransferase RimO [Victivallaceae bacterium]|nr:30S ribosomal protein S12 methylthiotransferase RimO [Victivallaceae bacterium]